MSLLYLKLSKHFHFPLIRLTLAHKALWDLVTAHRTPVSLSILPQSLGCNQPCWTDLNSIMYQEVSHLAPSQKKIFLQSYPLTLQLKSHFSWSPRWAHVPVASHTSFLTHYRTLLLFGVLGAARGRRRAMLLPHSWSCSHVRGALLAWYSSSSSKKRLTWWIFKGQLRPLHHVLPRSHFAHRNLCFASRCSCPPGVRSFALWRSL